MLAPASRGGGAVVVPSAAGQHLLELVVPDPSALLRRADADGLKGAVDRRSQIAINRLRALDGRRFIGWRIRSLFAGDARFNNCALRPGDVVTAEITYVDGGYSTVGAALPE